MFSQTGTDKATLSSYKSQQKTVENDFKLLRKQILIFRQKTLKGQKRETERTRGHDGEK